MRDAWLLLGLLAGCFATVGCQELPPGVLAGDRRTVSTSIANETTSEQPADAGLEARVRRLEEAVTPRDESELAREVRELRAELAVTRRRLASADRLLADEFGRRSDAAARTASVPDGSAVR